MKVTRNIEIQGKHNKPILTDLFYHENELPKEVVIFCHGYKGYKDWGAWNLIAEAFARKNYFFIKMNFSHNGGTKEQPIDFPDLEAFGHNNFSIELDDLDTVISWIQNNQTYGQQVNTSKISLIGHSRGGGIVVLKAAADPRISKVISWAGVSDFGSRFPTGAPLESWRDKGVDYILNSRTNQRMPHYFQFYTNFKENEASLTIKTAAQELAIPYLIVHGNEDETVPLKEAESLSNWCAQSSLKIIRGANHSFGSSQPWEKNSLPEHLSEALKHSLDFIKS